MRNTGRSQQTCLGRGDAEQAQRLHLTENPLVPISDVPSGIYPSPRTVHVTPSADQVSEDVERPEVTVRYTLDGSDPTAGSATYPSGGVYVGSNQTKTIKVRSFLTDWTPSPVRTITVHVEAS